MIVAIDGPAGVGKSTIAKHVAKQFGFTNLNSGLFYRGLTYSLLSNGVELQNEESVLQHSMILDFRMSGSDILLDGKILGNECYTPELDEHTPIISKNPNIRALIVDHIRKASQDKDLVCEGRDMTTVVFPEAEVKIFLDADPKVRAERRFKERNEGLAFEEILESIKTRDEIDRNKKVGGLKIAEDAIILDTSSLTISQVCAKVEQIINRRKTQ